MTVITQETFREWKNNIVTQRLLAELNIVKNSILQEWANGSFLHDEKANAQSVGTMQTINSILNFDPVNEYTEIKTDE